MIEVAIFKSNRRRSRILCEALAAGIAKVGDKPVILDEQAYKKPPTSVAAFYGLSGNLKQIFEDYKQDGRKVVFLDLGYWGRRGEDDKGRYTGHHKFAVNARHPTAYFQNRQHPHDRIARFKLEVQPWRTGKHILLAGMSAKSSWVEGFGAEEWERRAVTMLKAYTSREIFYRPKPSCPNARPIDGTEFSPKDEPLAGALRGCHAVVTHHSNVAIDGLIEGIPAFCWDGVATTMALQQFEKIDGPIRPEGREQWLADIAYTQWTPEEMREGLPWRLLKDEGQIP